MSVLFQKNLKFFSLSRLRLFHKISQNFIIELPACPRTGLLTHKGLFVTAAHKLPINDSVRDSFKNVNHNTFKQSDREAVSVDKALEDLDYAVKRTGRTNLINLTGVIEMIENEGSATQTQSLYMLRCCGLLKLEAPSKRIELLHKIWDKFKVLGVKFNIKHYNALIKVYLDSNHNFKPSDILIAMEHDGIEPNQTTYLYLMEKYCRDGDLNGANEILECVKEKGISVNQAVFHSLIKGHMRINDISGAKEIMKVMRSSNIMPTAETYTILACGFAEKGDVKNCKEILSEAEGEGIVLQNNNYLQIIEVLPCNEHSEFIDELLTRMKDMYDWRQEFINTAAHLVHKGMDSVAYKMILPICTKDNYSPSNIFIKLLVKMNMPIEKVVHYCTDLFDTGVNTYSLINASKCAVEFRKLDHAIALFNQMQNKGIPVRSRNFKDVFLACQSQSEEAWKYLKCMSDLGLRLDYYLYIEYVFPAVSTENPEKTLSKIQECGQPVLSAVDPLFQYYCFAGQLENAILLTKMYPVSVSTSFDLSQFLSTYDRFRYNPVKFFEILKHILGNSGFSRDRDIIQGELLALFLLECPRIFDEFHKSVGRDISYSNQAIDVCKSIVRRKSPSLVEHLRRFGIENPTLKQSKPITAEEEESLLGSDNISNYVKEAKLMDLAAMHIKNKDVVKLDRITAELEKIDRAIPPLMLCQILAVHCEIGNLDKATESLNKLNTLYPSFQVDSAKLFDYARLLLKYSKFDETKDFIKNNCSKEINVFSGNEILIRSMRRFFNNVVQIGDIELVKEIQNSLKKHAHGSLLKEVILEPLLKMYIYKRDLESCLKEFKDCVVNFNCAPRLNLLLKHFIMDQDPSKLQAVIDLASKCEGNTKVLNQLIVAFIELDHLPQAKKIIQNLGRDVDFTYLTEVGLKYYSLNNSVDLNKLLRATAGLTHDSRQILFHNLLKLHSNKNDYEKASQVLDEMRREKLEPSNESKALCNELFGRNDQPLPFTDISEKSQSASVPTNAESINFLKFLKERNTNEVLQILNGMKKGYVRSLATKHFTDLVELLVEEKRLNDISPMMNVMSYMIEFSTDIFKPLFEKYAVEGNVEAMQSISSVFPDFALRKCSFNHYVGQAYVKSNRQEDLLAALENRWNMKNKLFSNIALEEIMKVPYLEDRAVNLAKKYLEVNFDHPIAVAWTHYFISEKYKKADEISQICQIPVEKIDSMVLRHLRQTENITMGYKYVDFVSKLNIRDRSKERGYGTLLDLLVLKQMFDDAVKLVEDAKSNDIHLEKHYRSTLVTLKSHLDSQGKSVPFDIPMEVS